MTRPAGVLQRLRREETGATAVVVVLLMTVLLLCAALVVDVGAAQARKAQLQDAADAAALAVAHECVGSPGTAPGVCAPAVVATAWDTAAELAVGNLNDGAVEVVDVAFDADRVSVTVASTQDGYFGRIAGIAQTDLTAAATAAWSPSVTSLSLAMRACAFPEAGEPAVLQASLAVSPLLAGVLGGSCGLLSSGSLFGGVGNTLGVVSGGWLTTATPVLGLTPDDCSYDPNLLTTVAATLAKVVPGACADVVENWDPSPADPQLVLLPVFDDGTDQLLLDDVFGYGDIDRFALVEVTGYSFTGLLGLGSVPGSDPGLCLDADGVIGAVMSIVPPLLQHLLVGVTGCQALEGTFVGFVDTAEAGELLAGVRLVA